ncbi:MAG TPA: murein L,D-transpeptidase catalytic domain family protein [Allosphingosinicella sp.]|nr:murein L,D-transpeptidase catalytic domain family protein [Allosphingosinicella sp.]
MLGTGAAAGLLAAATAANAQSLAEIVARLKDPVPAPKPLFPVSPLPAQPAAPAVTGPINPALLARARAAFDRHRSVITHGDVVAIADFDRPSREPRFYLLDTASGRVGSHYVAHGRGSDPDHSGWLERFSNEINSEASSSGGYLTGDYYPGKYGRSLRVLGLDSSNSNAETRAIVIHKAWYAEPEVAAEHGKLGRSDGCFALSANSLEEVLQRLGPGHFLYADKIA